MSKPNIVVVMADQLAPQWTGAYGHPLVKTPHMDALAARGTRFDAAYCNSPLCAPSRASFMTGQQVSEIAAFDNAAEFPASAPTFAHYLRLAGYRTVLSGKMHFVGPDQLHGFEERLTTEVYPVDLAWTPDWTKPDERIAHWYHNMDAVRQSGTAMTTFQYDYDDEAVFLARRRIFEHAMTERNTPLAMVVSLIHPHDPYVARPEFMDLYDPADIPMPDDAVATDPHSARLRIGIEAEQGAVGDADIRRARHGYFANVSYFDDNVGKVIQALREADMLDNTIVVVTSDHGDMLGERGLWYKMSWLEHSARVPLIFAGPGVMHQIYGDPCSLLDVLPTFRDIAGEDGGLGAPVTGVSLWPTLQTGNTSQTEVVGEYCAEMTPGVPVCMIRRGPWKYIHCVYDSPVLYNLEEDPSEMVNLGDDPAYADIIAEFVAEAANRWDSEAIRTNVIASQTARGVVQKANEMGQMSAWDYQPPRDATAEYVRNTVSWDDVLTGCNTQPPGGILERAGGQGDVRGLRAKRSDAADGVLMADLSAYDAKSGRLIPVFSIEVQTLMEDTDRILDEILKVHPLGYGNYRRNASVSAEGRETAQPNDGSTTSTHVEGFEAGSTETYPMVELKLSIERDVAALEKVMDAILAVHHYEEPVIFVREDWVSRANYDPNSENPHRWWNNGRGLPDKLE